MAKAIKLKNDMYLDTRGIVHKGKILADILYPIGSVYMSTNSTNPETLFGGKWTKIEGRFLWATGNTPMVTGGSRTTDSTAITIDQMPAHEHNFRTNEYNPVSVLYDSGSNSWYGLPLIGTQTLSGKELHLTSTGGGKGHTHTYMPPYFEVYMWYRTA